jgi:hypothetical protein
MRKRIFAIAGISMSIMLFVASCAKDGEPGAAGLQDPKARRGLPEPPAQPVFLALRVQQTSFIRPG